MFLVILLFSMFASIFTLQKETLEYCEPFFLIGSRMLFAGVILLSYLYITNKKSLRITFNQFGSFLLLGLFAVYLTNICEIWGIKHMFSSKACLLYSLSPFLAALIAFIVLGEKLSKQKCFGMFVGFLGLIPIHFTQTNEEMSLGSLAIFSIAELSVVGAVLFSVYGWILLKKIMSEFKHSPLLANGISMTIGGILALVHSYLSGEVWKPIPVTQIKPFLIYFILMCLISNIICYNLYGMLLKRFTATFMSFAGLVTPFFASLYGYLFLNEEIKWQFFVSIVLFSIGLFLFYKDEIKHGQVFQLQKKLG